MAFPNEHNLNHNVLLDEENRLRSRVSKLEKINQDLRDEFYRQRGESCRRLESFRSDMLAKNNKIQRLLERRGILMQEKMDWEKRFQATEAERSSVASKLSEANKKLQGLRLEKDRNRMVWSTVLSLVNRTASIVGFERKPMDKSTKAMVEQVMEVLGEIESAFEGAENKMKEMKKAMDILIGREEEETDFVDVGVLLEVLRESSD